MNRNSAQPTPWDSKVFGVSCFEITAMDEKSLAETDINPGHYTIKVDPLASKLLLHQYGFYYADSLIEPFCKSCDIAITLHPDITISTKTDSTLLLPICDQAFKHGRFHRDFNLPQHSADQRYKQWLQQLNDEDEVFALYYCNELAGFIAHNRGKLLLHALAPKFRGRGLAKYFWSAVCQELMQAGIDEVRSSVSATNLAALNLYISLGFRLSNAVDVYHKLTR